MAAAVLVGVIPDKALSDRLYDEDGEAVWDVLPYGKRPESGEYRDCLGFSVVVSNGADTRKGDGEIHSSTTLEGFATAYEADVARARERWDAFAEWMKKEKGLSLPEPTLLLTLVERV